MQEDQTAKNWNPEEKQRCGRPCTTQKETVTHDVQHVDMRREEMLDKDFGL